MLTLLPEQRKFLHVPMHSIMALLRPCNATDIHREHTLLDQPTTDRPVSLSIPCLPRLYLSVSLGQVKSQKLHLDFISHHSTALAFHCTCRLCSQGRLP